ncbi:MAG TPA: hypothetical protein VLB69_04695 [Rudaea sp.]|nr:hypothetical protein [Rudaea sp.]
MSRFTSYPSLEHQEIKIHHEGTKNTKKSNSLVLRLQWQPLGFLAALLFFVHLRVLRAFVVHAFF